MLTIEQCVTPTFESEQAALPTRVHKRLQKAVKTLREDPTNSKRELDIKKLEIIADAWRLRVDDFRVIYTVKEQTQTFISVLPRKDVYRKLGIPDEDTLKLVPDIELIPVKRPGQVAKLPHKLTPELLTSWRIAQADQVALARCCTEDDLLEVNVEYRVFSRVVDLLYSRTWLERLAQPQYVLSKPTDLEDLAEGKLTTRLLRLDDHQRSLSALHLENARAPIVVKGSPGSGKSTVALYRAKLLAERYPDAKIAYTTYTQALKNASREQLAVLLPDGHRQIQVETVDSLAFQALSAVETLGTLLGPSSQLTLRLLDEVLEHKPPQLRKYTARYLLSEIFDVIEVSGLHSEAEYLASPRLGRKSPMSAANRKLIWALYEAFTRKVSAAKALTWASLRQRTLNALEAGRLTPSLDYLLIDEAQDLSPVTLRMLAGMVKSPGGLYITADTNQTLYESSFSWDALRGGWPKAEIHALKRNYRNTSQIVRALDDVREALSLEDSEAALEEGLSSGPRPQIISVSAEQQLDALIDFIRNACRDSREPQRHVAVLMAGNQKQAYEEGQALARAFKARKLKANYMSSKDLKLDRDCIKILSLYTSKGLEFPIVALWNVTEGILPRDVADLPSEEQTEEQLKDRRLFYVGCSRAMRQLAVFTRPGEESELLYDLQEGNWESKSWVG